MYVFSLQNEKHRDERSSPISTQEQQRDTPRLSYNKRGSEPPNEHAMIYRQVLDLERL